MRALPLAGKLLLSGLSKTCVPVRGESGLHKLFVKPDSLTITRSLLAAGLCPAPIQAPQQPRSRSAVLKAHRKGTGAAEHGIQPPRTPCWKDTAWIQRCGRPV